MKLGCLGGLDPPDWFLAGLADMSKVSVVKLRSATNLLWTSLITRDSTRKCDLEPSVQSCILLLGRCCAAHDVNPELLLEETQMLGLPKEHATQLSKMLTTHGSELRKLALSDDAMARFPFHASAHVGLPEIVKWNDFGIVAMSEGSTPLGLEDPQSVMLRLRLPPRRELECGGEHDGTQCVDVCAGKDQLRSMLSDLRQLHSVMSTIEAKPTTTD